MNLFVWGDLKTRSQMTFMLRRNYKPLFEPATLKGWSAGDYRPRFLFQADDSKELEGAIAPELGSLDFIQLDIYHAVAEGVNSRIVRMVEVVRGGKKQKVQAHVYVAGPSFSKVGWR